LLIFSGQKYGYCTVELIHWGN